MIYTYMICVISSSETVHFWVHKCVLYYTSLSKHNANALTMNYSACSEYILIPVHTHIALNMLQCNSDCFRYTWLGCAVYWLEGDWGVINLGTPCRRQLINDAVVHFLRETALSMQWCTAGNIPRRRRGDRPTHTFLICCRLDGDDSSNILTVRMNATRARRKAPEPGLLIWAELSSSPSSSPSGIATT
jgi:hypothetical protein